MSLPNRDPEWIPLLVPDMPTPEELLPWLERMHRNRYYSNFGPLVRELEAEFAQRFNVGADQVTTIANATLGLELVLQALNLPARSRVLVPAFTFVATATAVIRAGHVPVLADVDENTWLLTPEMARAAHADFRLDAVVSVATFGMPHDMQEWELFEHDTGLPVVIDAAGAYGSQWLQGVHGTLVFSMHTTKSLPAGEGGVVVSTRPGLAARVRQCSNFGINLNPDVDVAVGTLADTGTNAKMSEFHAAIGLCSLHKWEQRAFERRVLQADLINKLNQASGNNLSWQTAGQGGMQMAPTLLCARLPSAPARSALEQACQRARIMTRRWYQPLLNQMPVLKTKCQLLDTPNAQMLSQTLIGLPFFLGMTQEQRQRLLSEVRRALNY